VQPPALMTSRSQRHGRPYRWRPPRIAPDRQPDADWHSACGNGANYRRCRPRIALGRISGADWRIGLHPIGETAKQRTVG